MHNISLAAIILLVSVCFAQTKKYEGFGSLTKGGQGKAIYHVTSLTDDGSFGTLRDALSKSNRHIVFDTGGVITVNNDLEIGGSNITIDGSTAPFPGITLKKSRSDIVILTIRGIHDLIVTHVRVQGMWERGVDSEPEHSGTIVISGNDSAPARNIVIDHVTARNAIDSGLDIWGEVYNVTIQYSFIGISHSPQTISHYGRGEFKKRRNISIHHNIYARNNERNPQLRADTRTVDYVNNIVYDWSYWETSGYGIRIKNKWRPGEPKVTMNIINNAFIATRRPAWALVYGKSAGREENDEGPDQVLAQGAVYKDSDMDSLYVKGNILPAENMDKYSTISAPIPIPEYARVTTYAVTALADSVVPFVGTHYPLADELEIFQAVADSLQRIK